MGKILETTYHDTVEKITSFNSSLVNNSFYVLNDKKPSIVTYYNINKDKSSLDPGSKLSYNNIGKDTSIRFNKIEDFIIDVLFVTTKARKERRFKDFLKTRRHCKSR